MSSPTHEDDGGEEDEPLRCPICNKEVLWFGNGPFPGPCPSCCYEAPRQPVTDIVRFGEYVRSTHALLEVRERLEPMFRLCYQPPQLGGLLRCTYAVVVQIEGRWLRLTFCEYLPVDDWGNADRTCSVADRLHQLKREALAQDPSTDIVLGCGGELPKGG